uniref:ZMYM2-like/QRICH1 C-terminal domain-containing protein n=1 Tax=Amphimedon queenslandica TaxID=400682 RepID=A0A1X7V015_AMPQE
MAEKENLPPLGSLYEDNPTPKKRRVSLKLDKKPPRIAFYSAEEVSEISKGYVPPNTAKNTRWATKCFMDWILAINSLPDAVEKCPEDILKSASPEVLEKWIPKFVAEVRRADGQKYSPRTIHQIISGLLRYKHSLKAECPNMLDKIHFKAIDGACDTIFWEEEKQLWDSTVLNVTTPIGLLHAVFFYIGKVFCLCGGAEQRNLKPSQFIRHSNPDKYLYVENGSKNRSGGIAQLQVQNKVVEIYAVPENEPRCLFYLLNLYLSKLPPYAFENNVFYLWSIKKTPIDPQDVWYDSVPMGKNKLAGLTKDMSMEAGLEQIRTNHSLRAIGASAMFAAGVLEKIIQRNTGHRSIEALRLYEHVSSEQSKRTCKVLPSLGVSDMQQQEKETIGQEQEEKPEKEEKEEKPSVGAIAGNFFSMFHGCSIQSISVQIGKKE